MKTYKKLHESKDVANIHIAKIKERGGNVKQSVQNGKILLEYSFKNEYNYIEETYSNLIEEKGVIATKTDFFDKKGIKRLNYSSDSYLNEEPNTLFYYSWDFKESGLTYDKFREDLKNFFQKKYNKKVSNLKSLYVGWDRKEKGSY